MTFRRPAANSKQSKATNRKRTTACKKLTGNSGGVRATARDPRRPEHNRNGGRDVDVLFKARTLQHSRKNGSDRKLTTRLNVLRTDGSSEANDSTRSTACLTFASRTLSESLIIEGVHQARVRIEDGSACSRICISNRASGSKLPLPLFAASHTERPRLVPDTKVGLSDRALRGSGAHQLPESAVPP